MKRDEMRRGQSNRERERERRGDEKTRKRKCDREEATERTGDHVITGRGWQATFRMLRTSQAAAYRTHAFGGVHRDIYLRTTRRGNNVNEQSVVKNSSDRRFHDSSVKERRENRNGKSPLFDCERS